MKVGDLVRCHTAPLLKRRLGCLPHVEDARWSAFGMVEEVCGDGNVNVLWPDRGLELIDNRFLEVINETR